MFERIGAVFALLTVIPVRQGHGGRLGDAASALYAFPLAGLAVGAIAGGIGAALLYAGLEPILAAVITVASLALLTGMHHIDGLADLADSLMLRGTRERKAAVLKDPAVGAAGAASVAIYLMALVGAIYPADAWGLFVAVIAAEVIAKISMVAAMRSEEAAPESTAAPFAGAARSSRNVLAAAAIGIAIAVAAYGVFALAAVAAGVIAALVVARISTRSLGALRGDTLGAVNEISRLAALIVLVGFL